MFEKSTLIFGCGNILLGDDGFGPAVVEYLQDKYTLPDDVLTMDVGTSVRDILFNIILSEKKPRRIIIVDAVDRPGRRPGEVFEIPVKAIPKNKVSDFSLHQFPTVNMLDELQQHTPIDIKIVVAQTGEISNTISPGLSKAVQMAVEDVCQRIVRYVNEPMA